MKLTKHLSQGQLLHFIQSDEQITVHENEHYRWLAFNDTVQSVMLKRKPWQLTLPHQTALMLPLLFTQPNQIAEFGLGGGNISRFLVHYLSNLSLHSIEYSKNVINCFQRYFNPEQQNINLHHSSALDWLHHNKKIKPDWLICDIYQTSQSIEDSIQLTKNILKTLTKDAIFSINLPNPSNDEINYFLEVLRQISPNRDLVYFHIPNYLNVIIHLIPNKQLHTHTDRAANSSVLPTFKQKRWQDLWRYGIKAK